MQVESGIRALLSAPLIYRLFARVAGSDSNRRWFVDNVLALQPAQKVVDIGCGTGNMIELLPAVEYVGLDINDAYLRAARQRYGHATFIAGNVKDWRNDVRTLGADLVVANGVLHHVDDAETRELLEFARNSLKPGGRFVFYEPCYLRWQSRASRFFMAKDRGQNIRSEQEWKELANSIFPCVVTSVVTGVNRLGYTCIIGECYG
jgi:trans-aconitate methyltransferase